MWIANIHLKLFFLALLIAIKTKADKSACERKAKNIAALDLAKESISKAKNLQPSCVDETKNTTGNSSECGAKEEVSAYLDIARNLIDEAKENYSTCEETRNVTKVVLFRAKPSDCTEILQNGGNESGVYTIFPQNRMFVGSQLKVFCDMETDGGGWTVIQRRGQFTNKVDFYRNWNDYKRGFGNISEEFWIGNDNIFALTNQANYTVRFDLEDVKKEYRFAEYSSFWIDSEMAWYKIHFGKYNGTAGDGIRAVNNMGFSTKDLQYEKSNKTCHTEKLSGWWFENCGGSNPNGVNLPGGTVQWKYMNWYPWRSHASLLTIEIKLRRED